MMLLEGAGVQTRRLDDTCNVPRSQNASPRFATLLVGCIEGLVTKFGGMGWQRTSDATSDLERNRSR